MRLTAVHAAILAAVVAVGATVGFLSTRRQPARSRGAVLVISRRAPASSAVATGGPADSETPANDGHEERAMALASASMSTADRRRAIDTARDVRARLEARMSPFGDDLGDGDPADELRTTLQPHVPTLTAARAFERGQWESADLSVRVAASCDEGTRAPDDTCISLWNQDDGPPDLRRRARLLAWSVARAAVIDLGSRARAEDAAAALRRRTGLSSSTLGLVLLDDDLALRPTPDRAEILETAHELARALEAERGAPLADATELEGFARAKLAERAATWLDVPETAVVVVPRLSAAADEKGFHEEIAAAVGTPFEWRRNGP